MVECGVWQYDDKDEMRDVLWDSCLNFFFLYDYFSFVCTSDERR